MRCSFAIHKSYGSFVLASVLGLALGASGCKQDVEEAGSDLRTLDNLTRDDGVAVKRNTCGVAMDQTRFVSLSASDQDTLKRRVDTSNQALFHATAGALIAVPKPLQSIFFASNGRIVFHANPAAACSGSLTAAERDFAGERSGDMEACWRLQDGNLEIVMKSDPAVVRHQLLRQFSYVFTQFYADRLRVIDIPKEISSAIAAGLTRFDSQRTALAQGLRADLLSRGGSGAQRMLELAKSNFADFSNFALADAVDSYYCTAQTRASFQKDFPQTWKAFTSGNTPLTKDLGTPVL